MKIISKNCLCALGILWGGVIVATTSLTVSAQTAPGLAITRSGTNQVAITISNAIPADSYEIWWTPNLGNSVDFPWTMAAAGSIGQTNFILPNWEYPAVFFRGVLDTNTVPLWQQSNPNDPPSPILTITIASPANGATLQ